MGHLRDPFVADSDSKLKEITFFMLDDVARLYTLACSCFPLLYFDLYRRYSSEHKHFSKTLRYTRMLASIKVRSETVFKSEILNKKFSDDVRSPYLEQFFEQSEVEALKNLDLEKKQFLNGYRYCFRCKQFTENI